MPDNTDFTKLSKYRQHEVLRKLENISVFRYYIVYREIEYLLFYKWKCAVCGKYNKKRCSEEC